VLPSHRRRRGEPVRARRAHAVHLKAYICTSIEATYVRGLLSWIVEYKCVCHVRWIVVSWKL
jgi:hypothetical protein